MAIDERLDPKVMQQNITTWLCSPHEKLEEFLAFYPDTECRAKIIEILGKRVIELCWKLHRAAVDDTMAVISREEYRDLLEYKARYEDLCK